jgi:non-specific serine/threonine protein kinase
MPHSNGENILHVPHRQTAGQKSPRGDLIDRDAEMAAVQHALLGNEIRLLTVAGPAGMGKTRLAAEAARALSPSFPDGVWFVDLSTVSDLASIPSAIADALGADGTAPPSAIDRLHRFMEGRRILLILDNFEQVSAGANVVSELLASHPELRVLVTSRQPLRLRWENVLLLPPLDMPDQREGRSMDEAESASAVRLFVRSAQAVRMDFALTPQNVDDVVAICAYLEGIPLAIEIAADWTNLLPPSAILNYLRSEPSFLHSRTRDVPARQQSLIGTINVSYELLDQPEQALLRGLSVFVGGFTLEAATAVAGDTVPVMLDGLASLIDRSLLQLQPEEGAAPESRFTMLETVRTYALARLHEHEEHEDAQRRHAGYYASLAGSLHARVRQAGYFVAPTTPSSSDTRAGESERVFLLLDFEYPNIQAALRWMASTGEAEMELDLANALSTYWWMRGLLTTGVRWLEDALGRSPAAPASHRASALSNVGMLLRQQGELVRARAVLEEALSLARGVGDQWLVGSTLINLASALDGEDESQLKVGAALVQEALGMWEERGDDWGVAVARVYLAIGDLFRQRGLFAEGRLNEALLVFQRLRDDRSSAVAWLLLAVAARLQGDYSRVVSSLREGVALCRDLDKPGMLALCADLASWLLRGDDPLRAAVLVGASEAIRDTEVALSAYERHLRAEVMSDLRTRVREQALALALKQGHALSSEQVLELLEDDDGVVAVPNLESDPDEDTELTEREMEILRLMSEGLSNKQIADTIFVSEGTAKLGIRSIYRKLRAHNRAQAIGIADERSLIRDPPPDQ